MSSWTPDPASSPNLGRQGVAMPSAGIGVIFNPVKYLSGSLYWGYALNRRQAPTRDSLQAQGIEFIVSFNAL